MVSTYTKEYENCGGLPMKQHSLKKTELVSFVIASALGVLLHFMYEWTGENAIAGLFFPINESTWEHLKLIFFPVSLLALIEYFVLDIHYENFLFIKFLSVLLGMAVTIILFYTYTGIYGKNIDVLNILIYFLSMAAAYLFSYHWIRSRNLSAVPGKVGFWGFVILMLLFFLFTLFPPGIALFQSPV